MALFYATKDGNAAIVDELLRHGANPNAEDKALETPLHFAAREYQLETTRHLIMATRLYGVQYLNRAVTAR